MPSATQVPEFQIPVVDISAYLQNPSSSEARHVVDSVRVACTTSGFFQLKGHGIPADLVKALFQGAKALFALPLEEKKALKRPGTNRGYDMMGAQALQQDALPDMKEGYYIGKDIAFEDEQASRSFMTPNIWPSAEQVPESSFKNPMVDYYDAVEALCLRVLELVAAALPYGPDALDELKGEPIVASMRLLHYPPQNSSAEKQFGAGAHTDFGVITLLLTDGLPGLQVQNQTTGQWVSVPPDENAFVVNVGDMLQQITGGYFKSNLHRVLNLGDADRYSVPYFFDGCLDARLKRLDGADEDRILTVEEHMLERFATTYSVAKESRVG
ncbi:uncharacterized protein J3D65DRAFT_624737 [Phyllosticta citribraziliensis]|uniref:Fe2OG dioxygenase domain-containing protein n=1 Tax=Phyllosticta citribraziliensis TaxID=989973 RepID=A0ABR1LPU1_9PEZI